jgi:phosphoglycerate dehydrogenase-like enzyme
MTRMLNVSNGGRIPHVWTDVFVAALRELGELTLAENGVELSDEAFAARVREHEVVVVGWDARPLPELLAEDPGRLRYVCCYSGTIRGLVPRSLVEANLLVSNWGDHPAHGVAEAAMTLLLAVLKEIPRAVDVARASKWGVETRIRGTLEGTRVGIYGCGVIGRRFVELLRPFGAEMTVFDPYAASLPEGCARVDSLEELCGVSEVLVVHAGLTDETRRSIGAEHLAALPDGGVVVNTARGDLFDQEALCAEIVSGRLRAGLDVLEPDYLPPDHPLLARGNCLLTFHQLDTLGWPPRPGLTPMQQRCVDNLKRFVDGATPEWLFDLERYDRST